jgi:peptide/nickel transport system substrate-binding protein
VTNTLDIGPYGGDPHRAALYNLGSTLWDYDTSGLKDAGCTQLADISKISGALVESWTVSPDRTTITAKLGNVASQTGNPLTSEDVRWSVERTLALQPLSKFLAFQVAKFRQPNPVDVVDDKTFTLTTTDPTALDLAIWGFGTMMILDSKEVKNHATADDPYAAKWMTTNVANFGPWKLESFTPGTELVLSPNPGFAGKRGNITRFIQRGVPDSANRMQLVQSGDVDWTWKLTFDQYQSLQANSGGPAQVLNCLSPNRDTLQLQQGSAPLSDVRVREAISLAIDRAALVKGAYSGFATPAISGLSTAFGITAVEDSMKYDPERAKTLLAEAGVANGFPMQMTYCTCRPGPQSEQSSVLLQNMLANVGIQVSLNEVASDTEFTTANTKGQYQALLGAEPPVFADAGYSASFYVTGNASGFKIDFSSPKLDSLQKEITSSAPGPERDKLIGDVATLMATELPTLYLADVPNLYYVRKNITGYQHAPSGDLRGWQLSKS